MGVMDRFKNAFEEEEELEESAEMQEQKTKQPIKVQMIEPTRDGPELVSHPREIKVNIKWEKGKEVKLEDLTFDFHTTEIKTVCWGLDGNDESNCFKMGYCDECRVLFIITPPTGSFSDWRLDTFNHLFFTQEVFRDRILQLAGEPVLPEPTPEPTPEPGQQEAEVTNE
jgi:hypothetical protein